MKKNLTIACCILIFIGVLLYYIPYIQPVDVNLTGLQCRIGEDQCEGEKTVAISGTFYRYLFKDDYFTGIVDVSGYDFYNMDKTVQFNTHDGYGWICYMGIKNGAANIESLGPLLFTNDFGNVLILVSEPVYTSGSKGWNSTDGLYIAAPARTKTEALEIATKRSQDSQWLSVSEWY